MATGRPQTGKLVEPKVLDPRPCFLVDVQRVGRLIDCDTTTCADDSSGLYVPGAIFCAIRFGH